jgi:hypothetical protein
MRTRLAAIAAILFLGTPAKADDAGCTVVLCLLNPMGWAAVAECVPPVQSFVASVIAGGGAPSCSGSSVNMNITRQRRKPWTGNIAYTDADGVPKTIGF